MINICKSFIFLIFFLINSSFSNEHTSIQSGKKGECKIYIKQTHKNVFQEVKCTSELKYRKPIYGYDKNHCISYKTDRYARYFGKKS